MCMVFGRKLSIIMHSILVKLVNNCFVCFATTNIITFVCILQQPFPHRVVGQPLILLLTNTTLMWLKFFLLLVHIMG